MDAGSPPMDFNQLGYSQPGSPYARQLRRGFPWLKFSASLEPEFREHYQSSTGLQRGRMACLVAMLLIATLFAIDFFAGTPEGTEVLNVLRLAVMLPALFVVLLATLLPDLHRHYDKIAAVCAGVFGIALAYSVAQASLHGVSYLVSGLIMTSVYVYLFLGLLIGTAVVVNTVIVGAFAALAFALGAPMPDMLYQLAVLVTASVVSAFGGYTLEHALRKSFLESRLLQQLAERDGLTGLYNRRIFDDYMQRIWRQAHRERVPLQIIFVDIDDFKVYNDLYGHQAGDDCLKRVAEVLSHAAKRPFDICARYGGEEFVLVLYDPPRDFAESLPERLRAEIAGLAISHAGSTAADVVTASVGATRIVPEEARSVEGAIQVADEALYESKEAGRNRVTLRDAVESPVVTGSFRASPGQRSHAA